MRVLLIEDETTMARAIRRGLDCQGMLTEVEHDGLTGLHRARSEAYDAVVVDIMLPSMNGYDICKHLRAAQNWTPVLVLTAKDGEFDEVDAFDVGADDYLTKPFSFPVLVARLRSLIRRGAVQRPTIMSAGDLHLDPAGRTVGRGEQPIDLSPREFAVLEHLMRRKGTVVSKLEILQAVWDLHHDGDDNVVEVYISYLRRKIDTPFARRSIHTVRGVGYLLAKDGG